MERSGRGHNCNFSNTFYFRDTFLYMYAKLLAHYQYYRTKCGNPRTLDCALRSTHFAGASASPDWVANSVRASAVALRDTLIGRPHFPPSLRDTLIRPPHSPHRFWLYHTNLTTMLPPSRFRCQAAPPVARLAPGCLGRALPLHLEPNVRLCHLDALLLP